MIMKFHVHLDKLFTYIVKSRGVPTIFKESQQFFSNKDISILFYIRHWTPYALPRCSELIQFDTAI